LVDVQGVNLSSSNALRYSSTTAASGAIDATVSRNAAGIVQIGTTDNNASGSLLLTNLTASGLLDLRKAATANILQFSTTAFLRTDTSQLSIYDTGLARNNIALWRGGNFVVGSGTLIAASSGVDATGNVVDTSLSRNAAGVWQMGTTAANALGSLLLTNLTASGTMNVTGTATFATNLTVGSGLLRAPSVEVGSSSYLYWASRTAMLSPTNGTIRVMNFAETSGVTFDVGTTDGTLRIRNRLNATEGSIDVANLTASGSVFAAGSTNVYSFSSTHPNSAAPSTSWRFGSGWGGNYDTQFIFAYGDNAAKVLIDSTGAITAFGGYYVNVPPSSGTSIRPLQHGNSFVRFSAPASGIPGNNIAVEGWDSVLINASTGVIRNRIGGSDRLVLSNTDLTLTGNFTASGSVTAQNSIRVGTAVSNAPYIFPFTANTHTNLDPAGRGLSLYSLVNAVGTTSIAIAGDTATQTSGTNTHLLVQRTFQPTSGTGTYSVATITTTINQTGGANGITRGLFINPTLTAAADFRGIEVGDCGAHTSIRTGTGLVSFGDSVSITGNLTASGTLRVGGGTVVASILSATATLDFGSISSNHTETLTITVTGAVAGDSVFLGVPAGLDAGLIFCASVTAANTVTVRMHNSSGGSIDPASGTFRATVIRF
jgi:hypothetical protein